MFIFNCHSIYGQTKYIFLLLTYFYTICLIKIFHFQVGIEGITYAGNHGLEILHPDGSKFVHPMPMELQDKVVELLKSLQEQV